jgi:hypothetical protein
MCNGSPPATTLIIGRGSEEPGVEDTRGEGDRFAHCIDMELVEEVTHQCHPRIGMATTGRCNRVPIAAPSSVSPQLGAIAEVPVLQQWLRRCEMAWGWGRRGGSCSVPNPAQQWLGVTVEQEL